MENLTFSLNIILPIFFVVMIGAFLQHRGVFSDEFRKKATSLVFNYALPASLFQDVAAADVVNDFHARFVLYAAASGLLVYLAVWKISSLTMKDPKQITATVHGAFRGNFAYIGLAVCRSLTGSSHLTAAIMIMTFVIPFLYNVLAVLLFAHYDSSIGTDFKTQALAILKNPLIITVLIALPFSLLHITLPEAVDKTLSYMGQLATPLALLMIGASLKPSTFFTKPRGILIATLTKIVLAPLIFTCLAALLGFTGEELITLYTMHAVPSAANSYIMTEKLGGDAELGAGIVMSTTLFSVITMTAGICILRTIGFV